MIERTKSWWNVESFKIRRYKRREGSLYISQSGSLVSLKIDRLCDSMMSMKRGLVVASVLDTVASLLNQ